LSNGLRDALIPSAPSPLAGEGWDEGGSYRETYRINALDWQKEFPQIVKQGDFDAVIQRGKIREYQPEEGLSVKGTLQI